MTVVDRAEPRFIFVAVVRRQTQAMPVEAYRRGLSSRLDGGETAEMSRHCDAEPPPSRGQNPSSSNGRQKQGTLHNSEFERARGGVAELAHRRLHAAMRQRFQALRRAATKTRFFPFSRRPTRRRHDDHAHYRGARAARDEDTKQRRRALQEAGDDSSDEVENDRMKINKQNVTSRAQARRRRSHNNALLCPPPPPAHLLGLEK